MNVSVRPYKEWVHFSMNFYSLFLLVTYIPDIAGIDNLLIRNLFWLVRLMLACWILFHQQQTAFHFNAVQKLYLVVCLIYIVNIFIDVYLDPNYFVMGRTDGKMDLLGFILNIILALTFRYDDTFDSKNSFNFFWISLAFGLLLAFHFARLTPRMLLFDEETTRYDANSTVNTIGYGQSGCAMCLVSVYGLLIHKKLTYKLIFLAMLALGFMSIVKAGSRSPVVVFVLVMAFYLISRLGKLKGFILFASFIGLFIVFINPIQDLLHSMGSNIGDRLINIVVNRDTSGREEIWKNVISIIGDSPIFGAYYLVPSGEGGGMYPHNFYLEVFMATGLLGGIPFMILIFYTLGKTYNLLRLQHSSTWILLLYLQIIIFGFFSTGLYSSQECWILIFLILTIKIPDENSAGVQSTNIANG